VFGRLREVLQQALSARPPAGSDGGGGFVAIIGSETRGRARGEAGIAGLDVHGVGAFFGGDGRIDIAGPPARLAEAHEVIGAKRLRGSGRLEGLPRLVPGVAG